MLCSQLTAQTEVLPNDPASAPTTVTPSATGPIPTTPRADATGPIAVTPSADVDAAPRADISYSSTKLSHSDRAFLDKATKSGLKAVAVSQAVSAKLSGPGMRELAQMMITNHTAANTELQALAARKGFVSDKADNVMAEANRWAKNDKDVDDEYLEEMKDDHEKAVDVFQRGAKTEDAEIAAFAQKVLPKLQAHLDHIKSLDKKN